MSTQQPAPRQEEPSQLDQAGGFIRRLGTKRIVLILLVAYAVLLALFNLDSVDVSFVFFTVRTRLIWLILLSMVLGAVLAEILPRWWRGRRKR